MPLILACESSCDETAWCVYDSAQRRVIAHTLYSQIRTHAHFGGVVPELAAQQHIQIIDALLCSVVQKSGKSLQDITHVAATTHPGLPGALLIGGSYAKALAWSHHKPFIGVNHLAGHVYSVLIEHDVPFPYLCLSASGGHTALYFVQDTRNYVCLAHTQDDAAGELFDKVGKMLQLGYPGGPILDREGAKVNYVNSRKYPGLKNSELSFSFSGLKTAVLYDLVRSGYYDLAKKELVVTPSESVIQEVAGSVMAAVAGIFIDRIMLAHALYPEIQAIAFVGGVACNRYISQRIAAYAERAGISFFAPSREYCTDNAAMIAVVAAQHLEGGAGYACDIAP